MLNNTYGLVTISWWCSGAQCGHHGVAGVTMTTQGYEGPVLAWGDDFILETPDSLLLKTGQYMLYYTIQVFSSI